MLHKHFHLTVLRDMIRPRHGNTLAPLVSLLIYLHLLWFKNDLHLLFFVFVLQLCAVSPASTEGSVFLPTNAAVAPLSPALAVKRGKILTRVILLGSKVAEAQLGAHENAAFCLTEQWTFDLIF